jgi:hypothetical protein
VIKTITTETENVQLRRNEVKRLGNGAEEVSGLLKNISDQKPAAVLVVTYLDDKGDEIGIESLHLKDLEPNSVRKFSLVFKPPEGEVVKNRILDIGNILEAEITDALSGEEICSN